MGEEAPYDTSSISWIEKSAILRAQGISSPSRYLADRVTSEYRLPQNEIVYVPNLIDTDIYSPPGEINQEELIVLYAGRLESLKGAYVFCRAIPQIAKRFPNVQFVFLGADRRNPTGGSVQRDLETSLEQMQVRQKVKFVGHAPPEVFRSYYRRASVFVMPSLFENCPYTLLEAMACGLPAVVSRSGGMTEMIQDGTTGILFEPSNADELSESTIHLLESMSYRTAMGVAARESIVAKYAISVGTIAAEKFYSRFAVPSSVVET